MKSCPYPLILSLFCIILFSCDSKTANTINCDESTCYGFDIRQCGMDIFSDNITGTSKEDRELQMQQWLFNQNISADIHLEEMFYESVCEACQVCPEVDRYFVKILNSNSGHVERLEELGLFNLELQNCKDYFCN